MATTTYGTPYVSGTDLVSNWPAASLTVANSIDQAGYYVGRGTNTQTGSYTLVLTDAGKNITQAVNTANTITIPTNSSVAFPIGTRVNIINLGSGACTPTAAGGVTIAGTITALAINEYASLVKTGTNTWSYLAAATPAAPGLSLVTPTSVAGTGVTLSGGAVSFSASTTISVNGCFTSTYDNYMLTVLHVTGADTDLTIRLRLAGTDASATDYTTIIFDNSGTSSVSRLTGQTSTRIGPSRNGSRMYSTSYIFSPFAAAATGFQCRTTSNPVANTIDGTHGLSTSYDGFSLIPSSSSTTGTLRVYGLRNS